MRSEIQNKIAVVESKTAENNNNDNIVELYFSDYHIGDNDIWFSRVISYKGKKFKLVSATHYNQMSNNCIYIMTNVGGWATVASTLDYNTYIKLDFGNTDNTIKKRLARIMKIMEDYIKAIY